MIDLEKQTSSMASANEQATNSQVDGGGHDNLICLPDSTDKLKVKITSSVVHNSKPVVSTTDSSPKHNAKSDHISTNHEHCQEKNGFVTPVNKDLLDKEKPTHDSELAALGEKNCNHTGLAENADLPGNIDSPKKDCDSADELRKVLANVEQDLNLKNLKTKSSVTLKSIANETSSEIENKMPVNTNICQNTKEKSSIRSDNVAVANNSAKNNSKPVVKGSPAKEISDDPDDISIDLTEEEEEALLRPDPEVEMHSSGTDEAMESDTKPSDISSCDKEREKSQKSSLSISQKQKNKETSIAGADTVEDDGNQSTMAAATESNDAVRTDNQEKMNVDSESAVVDCLNEKEGKRSNIIDNVPVTYDGNIKKEEESFSWKFSNNSLLNNRKDILDELSLFENTAKEEGMQQAVDKVVQKILTDITPDSDSNDCLSPLTTSCSKNAATASSVTQSDDKKMFDEDDDDDLESELANSNKDMVIKRLLTTDIPLDKEETRKTADNSIKCEGSVKLKKQNFEEPLEPTTILELKRKLVITDEEKQVEKLGLTVKKVKLDSEPRNEETKTEDKTSILLSRLRQSGEVNVKHEKRCIKFSKQELEDLNARMITLYLTENERSEIGTLKAKCEYLEKSLEQWKKTAIQAQKQMLELNISLQRAVHQRKDRPGGPGQLLKVSTRTVGLQVQMQSFLVPDEKTPIRPQAPTNSRYVPPAIAPSPMPSPVGFPKVLYPPPANPQLAGSLKQPPLNLSSPVGAVATRMISPQGKSGVSILQPRITSLQPNGSPVVAGAVPKVASVTPPTSTPVRALLDSRRMQTTMNASSAHPVPMRLVPNQAVTKQVSPIPRPPVPTCHPSASASAAAAAAAFTTTATTTTAAAAVAALPTTVKIIDLTADEDENSAANQLHATNVLTPNGTLVTTSTAPSLVGGKAMTLVGSITAGTNVSNGQLIISTPVKGTMGPGAQPMLRVDNTVRAQAPPPPLLTPAPGTRLAYLVPTSVVRTPSVYMAPSNQVQVQPRHAANTLRPPVQTIVLQKGTALLPIQPPAGQLTTVNPIQQAAIRTTAPIQMRVTTAPSTPAVPFSNSITLHRASPASYPVTRSAVTTTVMAKPPVLSKIPNSTGVTPVGQDVVVSKITPKHPAALPKTFNANDDPNLKALPPRPALKIAKVNNGIVLSWNMSQNITHAEVSSYQLYAYQESNAPPSTALWKKVGDVKALPLPMACTLTQFMEGHKYHFAVRAMDMHGRSGEFSEPASIVLGSANSSTPAAIRA